MKSGQHTSDIVALMIVLVSALAITPTLTTKHTMSIGESIAEDQEAANAKKFVVIAHRGASGYLPEHTLEATAMAYAQGADFIEQDVVLTKDDCPVVLHDIHLDTVTDVATLYPNRKREDGRYYAIDFTLSEIRQLTVRERFNHETGKSVFEKRFPGGRATFRIPTFAESIEMVQGLNRSTGRNVGIYPEIKKPRWHRDQSKDISRVVLQTLETYGYQKKADNVFLQCFDPLELRRIREELDSKLRLVQLIGNNEWSEADVDYDTMVTAKGIQTIAQYADGIGPWMPLIIADEEKREPVVPTRLVQMAHDQGLLVHPFTFRADSLPKYVDSFEELINLFQRADVDGFFSDHPDQVIDVVR